MADSTQVDTLLTVLKYAGLFVGGICGFLGIVANPHEEKRIPSPIIGGEERVERKLTVGGKRYLSLLVIGFLVALGAQITEGIKQKRDEVKTKTRDEELAKKISNEGSSSRDEIRGLRTELATNPAVVNPSVRLAILGTEEKRITEKRNALDQQRQLIAIEPVSLNNLRLERSNRTAIIQFEKDLVENRRRQAEIEQQRIQEEDKQAQELAQKKAQESALAKEKLVTDQCLSVFDDVLGSFYSILMSLAKDTGNKVFSDFPKNPPTTVQSSFFNEGKIVRGTNSLSLGTNLYWSFDIRSQVTSQSSPSNQRFASFSPASLRISCKGKDGLLFLHVSPTISASKGEVVEDGINQVFLRLKTSNQAMTNGQYSMANYAKAIDEALRTFLSAQDEQFPLSTTANR